MHLGCFFVNAMQQKVTVDTLSTPRHTFFAVGERMFLSTSSGAIVKGIGGGSVYPLMNTVSDLLDKFLKSRGFTQGKLATDSGIDKTTVSKHMSGERNPGPKTLAAYSKALRLSAAEKQAIYAAAGRATPAAKKVSDGGEDAQPLEMVPVPRNGRVIYVEPGMILIVSPEFRTQGSRVESSPSPAEMPLPPMQPNQPESPDPLSLADLAELEMSNKRFDDRAAGHKKRRTVENRDLGSGSDPGEHKPVVDGDLPK